MFKVTCLIALKRKDQSPRILHLEILIDLLLKVFVRWLQNDSLNAQAYKHINATIISIGIDWRERGYDSENFGTRITWFEVMVEKIWSFEVSGLYMNLEGSMGFFRKLPGLWWIEYAIWREPRGLCVKLEAQG
jgi:hypothetical protein